MCHIKQISKVSRKTATCLTRLPWGKGLFSPIQMAMKGNPDFINLTANLKQILADWRYIIHYMAAHPTDVSQLIIIIKFIFYMLSVSLFSWLIKR